MDYSVSEVNIDDPAIAERVTRLVNASFTSEIADDRIARNTKVGGEASTLYLAAHIGDDIIGFNAFIPHRVWMCGKAETAYQSCWTATSDAHRGKGIFQNLINAGRDTLRYRAAAFMFGFPNANSRPIFVNKLGFREIASLKWQAPLLPGLRQFWICRRDIIMPSDIAQDDNQLIAWKQAEGANIVRVCCEGSFIWGVRRKSMRCGITLSFFDMGGIHIERQADLRPLLSKLYREIQGCIAIQAVTVEGNTLNALFKGLRATDPPLIVDDLTRATSGCSFSFLSGTRDYY